ncbi:UrcA family protein [Phenylobacterium deserti]|uniref:UrcA family protein n=1 Tax=Phenylobacterium deserti TaxID=1914756 RepID=A0A328ASS5_9CAUL|nr:UrcA family protein [Phenylobacterium deserti]RAK57311.1 hypothetical protein DJ018_05030 [Phenylobacterium deserti]
MFSTRKIAAVLATAAALAAGAAQAEAVRTQDLDLTTSAGATAYQARVDRAANRFCAKEVGIAQKTACKQGVVAEMSEKFAGVRSAQLAARERASRQASIN